MAVTKLEPSTISTDTAPYDALLSLTGTNFNNVDQVTFTWSGAASGSDTWDKGSSDWNAKVSIDSDTYMTLRPRVVEPSPTWSGMVNWTVTLRDISGGTASASFTVIYQPIEPPIADSWRFPLDGDWVISQDFANDKWGGYHLGEDVKRNYEAPVYAPANGIVKHNSKRTNYGYVVIIEHKLPDGNYVCSVLGHLREKGRADVGTVVSKGQLVGYLSSIPEETGYTFTHLHFGIRNGRYIDGTDPDGKWRYRGYGPGYIADLWYRPSDFIYAQGIPPNSTKFKTGDHVEVKWETLNLRENYGLGAKVKTTLRKDEQGKVIDHFDNGKYCGGYWWWHVEFRGKKGWCAEAGLEKAVPVRTVQFSGYTWIVKSSESPQGPGPNYWSDSKENVWVDDQGRLHLKITERNGKWYCAEVYTEESFGHGEYTFYMASRIDQLDKNVVCGLFTYLDDNHEIDIEFSRWGDAKAANAQYVVQPWSRPGNIKRFNIALNGDYSTHRFIWRNNRVDFRSLHGRYDLHYDFPPSSDYIISQWTYTGSDIPAPSTEKVHINLWLMNGQPPSDGQKVEVVIEKVEFKSATTVTKILPVPYYNQGNTNWCVPTSMAMIFRYYYGAEKNIHSWDIAKAWNWDRDIQWWQILEPTYGMIRDYFNNHGLKTVEKISDAQDFYKIRTWLVLLC